MPYFCLERGCKKQASFNYEYGQKYDYCAEHKKDGMKDIKKRTCLISGCNIFPNFHYEGNW